MNSEKIYIGKGKQFENGIISVTLKLDDLYQFEYKYKGVNYITFNVAKLKETDKYGRTHTCYHHNIDE